MGGILVLKAVWMLSTKVLQCGLSTQIRSPRESSMYTYEDGARTSACPPMHPPAHEQEEAGSLSGLLLPLHSQQLGRGDALGCHTQPSGLRCL